MKQGHLLVLDLAIYCGKAGKDMNERDSWLSGKYPWTSILELLMMLIWGESKAFLVILNCQLELFIWFSEFHQ